jgi:DNA-binding MarR family transcriptional regulator
MVDGMVSAGPWISHTWPSAWGRTWREETLNETMVTEPPQTGATEAAGELAVEELSKSIWQLTEDVLILLRSQSQHAVHKQKKPELLWLDDLTETQANTVIAVRQLCDETPEGITLKKLAETLGVTPAGASVMVDLLVKKKMLKRTKSKSDRRAILIRLTTDTAHLFDISESSLLENFMGLHKTLGPDGLRDWQGILLSATTALRKLVGERAHPDADQSETSPDDGSPATEA